MSNFVLDAWAIMAWLKGQQPAAERVRYLLESAERHDRRLLMNIINIGEVFYLCVKARGVSYAERVLNNVRSRVTSVPATDELVMAAAKLLFRMRVPLLLRPPYSVRYRCHRRSGIANRRCA